MQVLEPRGLVDVMGIARLGRNTAIHRLADLCDDRQPVGARRAQRLENWTPRRGERGAGPEAFYEFGPAQATRGSFSGRDAPAGYSLSVERLWLQTVAQIMLDWRRTSGRYPIRPLQQTKTVILYA